MSKIVAIHQPNFFPWLGYFDKFVNSDVFIVLDDVQLPKTGGTWSNRVRILKNGEPKWMTVPIDRSYSGVRPVNRIHYDESKKWRESVVGTIQSNYSNSPFFEEVFCTLKPIIELKESNIAKYTTSSIIALLGALDLNSDKLVLSSAVSYSGSANDMLVSLVLSQKGTAYLCGGGAQGYMDEKVFEKNRIHLIYQNYVHPEYPQAGSEHFSPGLSIIDALMNLGWKGTKDLLIGGLRK